MSGKSNVNDWYVYCHIRLDKNQPFYIGIGRTKNFKRAYSKSSRNVRWLSITKNIDYSVEIILDKISKEEAIRKEIELIDKYKRECFGGILCNQTSGGEGIHERQDIEKWKKNLSISALNMTEEHKRKISESLKGHRGYMKGKNLTEEQKSKISKRHKGVEKTEEHREKLRRANLGKKLSQETKDKIKLWNINVGASEEARKKMSSAASYKRSEETKKKMSEARKKYFENKKLSYAS